MQTVDGVDPSRIALWGFFWSGTMVLEAASLDKRVAAVAAIGPVLDWTLDPELGPPMMARAMADRAARLRGDPPAYIPFYRATGDNFMIFKAFTELPNTEQKRMLPDMVEALKKQAPDSFDDHVTLQTLYKIANWAPFSRFALLGDTPVLWVIPELDELSAPALQKQTWDGFAEPKALEIAQGRGHFNYWHDADLDQLLAKQLGFLKEFLKF